MGMHVLHAVVLSQLEAELKRAAAGSAAVPDWWGPIAPGVRQNFHVLWRAGGVTASSSAPSFVPDGQLLWELTRPYCGLSRFGPLKSECV